MTKIAFLGAGNIAQAIMGGLIRKGISPADIRAADPSEAMRAKAEALGIAATAANAEAAQGAETVLICVKPNLVAEALASISKSAANPLQSGASLPDAGASPPQSDVSPRDSSASLYLSVAAGVTTQTLGQLLGEQAPIVRAMPNTPALIGQGMTALYAATSVGPAHRQTAEAILAAVGETVWVEEEAALDAVTAVSGSGPAYFFYLMEAIIAAAEAEGLPPPLARQLALQTAQGATQMPRALGADPAELRRQVSSPGGTTEAAIESLAAANFPEAIAAAIAAARARAQALSQAPPTPRKP